VTEVILLTKPDCALCDQAKLVLERVGDEYQLSIEALSVTTERGTRLATEAGVPFPPAVLLDGKPFSYGRLSERKLRRELDRRRD
jgi:glutaredoxin